MTEERERLKNQIIKLVEEKGYPGELGALAADSLGSEKAMTRMIGWLPAHHLPPLGAYYPHERDLAGNHGHETGRPVLERPVVGYGFLKSKDVSPEFL